MYPNKHLSEKNAMDEMGKSHKPRDRKTINSIQTKTETNPTESEQTNGEVAQGDAILPTLSLPTGTKNYFSSSMQETSGENMRLKQLVYQDDLVRWCQSAHEAQVANDKTKQGMKQKQVQANIDKSSYRTNTETGPY